jgi:DNA-binding protein H-NS
MIHDLDLLSMSRKDLEQLQADVDNAIKTVDARKRQDAIKAAREAAMEHGYRLEDIVEMAGKASVRKSKTPPKYRHPEDPAKTWSGRGRQPAWIKEKLDNGESLDAFAI